MKIDGTWQLPPLQGEICYVNLNDPARWLVMLLGVLETPFIYSSIHPTLIHTLLLRYHISYVNMDHLSSFKFKKKKQTRLMSYFSRYSVSIELWAEKKHSEQILMKFKTRINRATKAQHFLRG